MTRYNITDLDLHQARTAVRFLALAMRQRLLAAGDVPLHLNPDLLDDLGERLERAHDGTLYLRPAPSATST